MFLKTGNNYGNLARVLFVVEGFFFVVLPMMATVVESPSNTNTNVLIVTTIIGFMTMVVQQFFASYNFRKQHAFDVQDREEKARQLALQVAGDTEKLRLQNELRDKEIKLMLTQRQAEMERQQQLHAEAVQVLIEENLKAIQENSKEARAAFHEANQANGKIADLHAHNVTMMETIQSNLTETKASTKAAKEAYHEANSVNNKIADLQQHNLEMRKEVQKLDVVLPLLKEVLPHELKEEG